MEKNQKTYILFFILALGFVLYFLFIGYDKLGIFADDIGTIYYLNREFTLRELIIYSHNWDAARDLHLIWQKFFLSISQPEIIKNIHFYQLLLYLLNSLILFWLLIKFKIDFNISFICVIFFIFFTVYSEVAFWTHAFTMVLMSTFFFLIFIILNLYLSMRKTKNLTLELLSLFFLILCLFTYEQAIITSLLIIFIREVYLIKEKNKKLTQSLFTFFLYLFLIISFAIYKLNEAGTFNNESQLYFTGSKTSQFDQILKNIIHSYAIFIIQLVKVDLTFFYRFISENYLILIIFLIVLMLLFLNYKKNIIKNNDNYIVYKIIICFILYTSSMFPLYLHYISDRHFYIPSIFAVIGLSYIITSIYKFLENKRVKLFFLNFVLSIFLINNIVNFNISKNHYINNFEIKKKFYQNLGKTIDLKRYNHLILVNFPDLYNETIFFAHEQADALKLALGNDNNPSIIKENNRNLNNSLKIKFTEINNNKIIYEFIN